MLTEGDRARLREAVGALGQPVDPGFGQRAEAFLAEVARWSRVGRLTGYRTPREWVDHLLLDSLLFLQVLPQPASPLLDIGSGIGAPGLILKLARPGWEVGLVEANRRRANFLRQVARRLALEGLAVYGVRAEALAREPALRGRFRTVTMRAVAPARVAAALGRPFLRPDGHLVLGLGPAQRPGLGAIREVPVPWAHERLHPRRRFLIIPAAEIPGDVPRGTSAPEGGPDRARRAPPGSRTGCSTWNRGGGGSDPRGRQPEGGRREDDHGDQPGRGPRRRGAGDSPGRPGSPDQRDGGELA